MKERIEYAERVFLKLMDEGFPDLGLRVLNHGVCSGLLLLLAATFYFRVAYGMDLDSELTDPIQEQVRKRVNENCDKHKYDPYWHDKLRNISGWSLFGAAILASILLRITYFCFCFN